jgi:ribosomal protein L14
MAARRRFPNVTLEGVLGADAISAILCKAHSCSALRKKGVERARLVRQTTENRRGSGSLVAWAKDFIRTIMEPSAAGGEKKLEFKGNPR